MDLWELGNEYIQTSLTLAKRIKELNVKLDGLPANERIILKRRISLLCYDVAQCRKVGKILTQHTAKENH